MSISESDLSRPAWPGLAIPHGGQVCKKNYRDRASLRRIKLQSISKQQGDCLTWILLSMKTNWTTCRFPMNKQLISELLMGFEGGR